MSLINKIWCWVKQNEADIILIVGIVLIALISFGGGWLLGSKNINTKESLSKIDNSDKVKTEELVPTVTEPIVSNTESAIAQQQAAVNNTQKAVTTTSVSTTNCKYVGSKNSDVYHLPECPGAQRIKEENKKCFSSKEEAEKAGYRPAQNCPGLQQK